MVTADQLKDLMLAYFGSPKYTFDITLQVRTISPALAAVSAQPTALVHYALAQPQPTPQPQQAARTRRQNILGHKRGRW